MRDFILLPEDSPARRYTENLVDRLVVGDDDPEGKRRMVAIISEALRMARRDIVAGDFVLLEHIGEFIKVDNHGPMIRYQADRRLLESCCIQNLKIAGEN